MNLDLADCPDWLASGSQKSLGSASLVLEFRAYVTMPGLLCGCRESKLGSQACSVSSLTGQRHLQPRGFILRDFPGRGHLLNPTAP